METKTLDEQAEVLYWEHIATTKRYVKYTSEIEKRAVLKARGLASGPATALEIGCEGGRWSKLLSDADWKLICTDIDQQALDICKRRIPAAKCILVSSSDSKLPCDAENLELVFCIEVPEVINAAWFVDEAFRVLQTGGMLVGVFFNRHSWRGLMHQFSARLRGDVPYVYQCSYPHWRKGLCEKGFHLVYEEGFGWSPFRKSSNSILVPVITRIEHSLGVRKIVSLSPMIAFIARKVK